MNEEVMRVLKLVEEGKLSADKAKELIDALGKSEVSKSEIIVNKNENVYEDKFLKINVLSAQGDKVNVQLPIKVIREIIKVTGKLPIQSDKLGGLDLEQLMNTVVSCLDNEAMGQIVDICSAEGDIVKIVIE